MKKSKPIRFESTPRTPEEIEPVNYLTFFEFSRLPAAAQETAAGKPADQLRRRYFREIFQPLGCPFCGKSPKLGCGRGEGTERFWVVKCNHRACHILPLATGDTITETVAKWNTRAPAV